MARTSLAPVIPPSPPTSDNTPGKWHDRRNDDSPAAPEMTVPDMTGFQTVSIEGSKINDCAHTPITVKDVLMQHVHSKSAILSMIAEFILQRLDAGETMFSSRDLNLLSEYHLASNEQQYAMFFESGNPSRC